MTDSSKHTPGPWVVDARDGASFVRRPNGGPLSVFPLYVPGTSEESAADARLIAAAPDMLAALQQVMDMPALELSAVAFQACRDAYNKATGD